jgi:hypothetical protein
MTCAKKPMNSGLVYRSEPLPPPWPTRAIRGTRVYQKDRDPRMPALLAEKDYGAWLDVSASAELLWPAPEDLMQRLPVSKRLNSSKAPADDTTLIDRIDLGAAVNFRP